MVLSTPIKTIGIYAITIKLHSEVSVDIRVNIAQSVEEANMQEKHQQAEEKRASKKDDSTAVVEEALEQIKEISEED